MQHPRRHKLTPPRAAILPALCDAVSHHSNRLCPAYRSHPRPDHQPCPPPSPCESHPRHRAAPAVFQTSAASCGAKALPARGPSCPHRQSARSARKQFDSSPRPRSRHSAPSVSAPAAAPTTARKTDSAECRDPAARKDGSRCSQSVTSKGALRRALALPGLGRNTLRASLARSFIACHCAATCSGCAAHGPQEIRTLLLPLAKLR
jgi:hypothetical protein